MCDLNKKLLLRRREGSGVLRWAFLYVCVCLSLRSHISKNTHSNLTKFFVRLTLAMARMSSGSVPICHVLSALWMTSCFHGPSSGVWLLLQPLLECRAQALRAAAVLIASWAGRRRAPRLDESFVQGVPGRSMRCIIAICKQWCNIRIRIGLRSATSELSPYWFNSDLVDLTTSGMIGGA